MKSIMGACASAVRKQTSPEAVQRIDAEQKTRALRRDRVARSGLADGAAKRRACRSMTCNGRRPSCSKGGGEGKKSGGIRVGLADGSVLSLSAKDSERRQLTQYDVVYVKATPAKARMTGMPSCVRGRKCRAPRSFWKTRPGVFWRWSAASLIRSASSTASRKQSASPAPRSSR